MLASRNMYVSSLLALLLFSILKSYLNLSNEPTTFETTEIEHSASIPSLTICPRQFQPDIFTSFEQIIDALGEAKNGTFYGLIKSEGKGVINQKLSLIDSEVLKSKFNKTLDEVWTYAAIVEPTFQTSIVICATLNVPFIEPPKQGYYIVHMKVLKATNPKQGGFYFEKHEYGQSMQNYDFDRSQVEILHDNRAYNEYLTETETNWLKKSNFECIEDNSIFMTSCIDEFIAEEIGCILPWTKTISKLEKCSGTQKLIEFRNLSTHITSEALQLRLKTKGCMTPNCKKRSWTKTTNTESWQTNNVGAEMNIYVPFTAKVIKYQEIFLADFSTFLADCGSYMGLFLGASILSLTDTILSLFNWLKRRYERFVSPDEIPIT